MALTKSFYFAINLYQVNELEFMEEIMDKCIKFFRNKQVTRTVLTFSRVNLYNG
jgi:hypothetical protein